MGLPFPSASERVSRLEEVLKIAMQLWSGEDKPFDGTYYHLTSTIGNPLYVQRPHPPILIGGNGNRMLRLMAQYADIVSIGFGGGLDDLRAKLETLQDYCQQVNRPYTDIQKTTPVAPILKDGVLDTATIEYMHSLAALGIDEVTINYPNDPERFDQLTNSFMPLIENLVTTGR
jgi:alkanesulfonate monooxygenase SsuD/methylene tetrahydromethanopterin reductase-like flavin-dependent oxidoreductase (luciferase family)